MEKQKVVNLPTVPQRALNFYQAIMDLLQAQAVGMDVFTILGVLELTKATVLKQSEEG